jgi:hypothetical protein
MTEDRGPTAPRDAEADASSYFRGVSRAFLARRDAPLMLSAAEIDLVASWRKAGIPLDVVLEGIERTFERPPAGSRPRGRGPTLAYCRAEVGRAMARWRDRRVGESGRSKPRQGKCERALAEVDRFLASPGPAPESVLASARRARDLLLLRPVDEEALERLDAEADEALLRDAPEAERKAAADGRARLVTRLRERLDLPYFALFNY